MKERIGTQRTGCEDAVELRSADGYRPLGLQVLDWKSMFPSQTRSSAAELCIDGLCKTGGPLEQVAPVSSSVKAAPAGPPAAGPDGPAWTEPDPSAGRAIRSAGKSLPTFSHTDTGKDATR
jgi:hypothetical protein